MSFIDGRESRNKTSWALGLIHGIIYYLGWSPPILVRSIQGEGRTQYAKGRYAERKTHVIS